MDENGEVLQTITLIDGSVSAFVTEMRRSWLTSVYDPAYRYGYRDNGL